MTTEYIFTASDGEELAVTAYGETPGEETRCIIYAHGFKGFKDWGFVPHIGEYLSGKGFLVLTFNFSHNGIGDNLTEFTKLKKFAQNTFSREVRELCELIDAVSGGVFGPVKNPPIGLLGHSRGGGVALLTTACRRNVAATTVWSSVKTFDRYSDDQKRQWREDGYLEVLNARTGQVMHLNVSLLDDFEMHQDELLNVEQAVRSKYGPLLVVHGENDEGVPVDEGKQIHRWSGLPEEYLMLVPETGHTFDAAHPFNSSNPKLEEVLKKTAWFFKKHL